MAVNNSYLNLQTPMYSRSSQNFQQIPTKAQNYVATQSHYNKYANIMSSGALAESQSTSRINKKSLLNYR
jgi:phosphoribulokinase